MKTRKIQATLIALIATLIIVGAILVVNAEPTTAAGAVNAYPYPYPEPYPGSGTQMIPVILKWFGYPVPPIVP